MTLDHRQQDLVRKELRTQFALAELTEREAAADLEWTVARLRRTMHLDVGADPVDVWQLRDYIRSAVKAAGRSPRFTVLTGANRIRASLWFRLRKAPRRGRARGASAHDSEPSQTLPTTDEGPPLRGSPPSTSRHPARVAGGRVARGRER